jgi:hypothetical protein
MSPRSKQEYVEAIFYDTRRHVEKRKPLSSMNSLLSVGITQTCYQALAEL